MKRSLVLALLTLGLLLAFGSVAMAKVDVTVSNWDTYEVGVPVKDNLVAVLGLEYDGYWWKCGTCEDHTETDSDLYPLLGVRYFFNSATTVKPYAFGKLALAFDGDEGEENDTTFGVNAGLGLEKQISDDFSIVGEVGLWFSYNKDGYDDDKELDTYTDANLGLKFYL